MKQTLVNAWERVKEFWQKARESKAADWLKEKTKVVGVMWEKVKTYLKSDAQTILPVKDKFVSFVVSWWQWLTAGVFVFLLLYYPAGALLYHRVDLNPAFNAGATALSAKMPETAEKLILREVESHSFAPNVPFIFPVAILDNMPAFQTGVIEGVKRTAVLFAVLNPQSEQLKQAVELLNYPADVWHIRNWKPAEASTKKYAAAAHALQKYEAAVQAGEQTYDVSPEALQITLLTLADGLKECTDALAAQVAKGERRVWDTKADDVFFYVKGQAYVYYLMLRDLKHDYKSVFSDSVLEGKWEKAEASLKKAVSIQPLMVANGSAETQFAPNHLLGFGFYLGRAAQELTRLVRLIRPVENEAHE